MYVKTVKLGYFKQVLKTTFTEAVKQKKYKRLPFDTWKQIMAYHDEYSTCIVWDEEVTQDQYSTVRLWIPGVWDGIYSSTAPTEFGSFLLDYAKQLNDKVGEATMTTNTTSNINDCTTTTYATSTTPINGHYVFDTTSNDVWTIQTSPTYTWATTDDFCRKSECPYNKKEEKNKKEKKTMFKNFDFGPCTNDRVALSPYGVAVQNLNGAWVSYNKDSKQIIDVDIFHSVDGRKFLYKMPVAISQVAIGDVILHNGNPVFVESIENGIQAVDISVNEKKTIMPTTNMFGFDFITKIVSVMDVCATAPTPDQPFGNMLPFMMMDDGKDNDNMLLAMMMMNGNMDMSNPMMMYFMFKDNKDMFPLMFMMNQKK